MVRHCCLLTPSAAMNWPGEYSIDHSTTLLVAMQQAKLFINMSLVKLQLRAQLNFGIEPTFNARIRPLGAVTVDQLVLDNAEIRDLCQAFELQSNRGGTDLNGVDG